MNSAVLLLQLAAGGLWLIVGIYLLPRIVRAWRRDARRPDVLSAPLGFMAWLQVGFSLRWLAWSHSIPRMASLELVAWAALYALSAMLAVWFFVGALATRND